MGARVLSVVIPGDPHAQGRGRAGVIRKRGGGIVTTKGGHPIIRVHEDAESFNWKATAQQHMKDAIGGPPLSGPVAVVILAVFALPASRWLKNGRRGREWKAGARFDIDNIQKAVFDAGNGVWWMDDGQICRVLAEKVIAAQGEPARVEARAWAIEEGPKEATRNGDADGGGSVGAVQQRALAFDVSGGEE